MGEYTKGVTIVGGVDFVFHTERNEPAKLTGSFLPEPQTVALSSAVAQHERIAVNPNILSGIPFVRGTRIPLAAILDGLAEGLNAKELMEHYPRLTIEDIRAGLEYAGQDSFVAAE